MLSIPSPVMHELIDGNMAYAVEQSHAGDEDEGLLKKLYAEESPWMAQASLDAPVVYAAMLVNDQGHSPTPIQWKQTTTWLRRYCRYPHEPYLDRLVAIDNAFQGKAERNDLRAGRHKFLWKHGETGQESERMPGRAKEVLLFCDVFDKALALHPPDVPLVKAPYYFGYAFNYIKEHRNHLANHASSFLLQLVRHILQVLFPGRYSLRVFPICFTTSGRESKYAELVLSCVGDGLAYTGGGYGVHAPGLHNSSSEPAGWLAVDATRFWREKVAFRKEFGIYGKQRDHEMKLLKKGRISGRCGRNRSEN
ncbi:hypothetical protein BDV95DRAFT_277582 [Massariosphaeria phaeospora]|uniref:Uncharacterized protein n=1 Tax=Massariosphaeria phaeospora TaxID=100035 RepID=A0A7C8MD69_9PLEO|nr:hypothetical protein BDV95DRAFT_277582 [Massariosphaeria phaeospora]